tara:strand:+ start:2424 stop:2588 length:165 start_codon:yes stop_codon:yes gene_type:complete
VLEIIGFIALGYVVFKFAPKILEAGFKFAVIMIGLVSFLILINMVWGEWSILLQ